MGERSNNCEGSVEAHVNRTPGESSVHLRGMSVYIILGFNNDMSRRTMRMINVTCLFGILRGQFFSSSDSRHENTTVKIKLNVTALIRNLIKFNGYSIR